VNQGASRYVGALVAKCYYAKRKLIWEVLDSGLKSKMVGRCGSNGGRWWVSGFSGSSVFQGDDPAAAEAHSVAGYDGFHGGSGEHMQVSSRLVLWWEMDEFWRSCWKIGQVLADLQRKAVVCK
jgi:hypothetical protein